MAISRIPSTINDSNVIDVTKEGNCDAAVDYLAWLVLWFRDFDSSAKGVALAITTYSTYSTLKYALECLWGSTHYERLCFIARANSDLRGLAVSTGEDKLGLKRQKQLERAYLGGANERSRPLTLVIQNIEAEVAIDYPEIGESSLCIVEAADKVAGRGESSASGPFLWPWSTNLRSANRGKTPSLLYMVLAVTILKATRATCAVLLSLSRKPTSWEDGKPKFMELFNVVISGDRASGSEIAGRHFKANSKAQLDWVLLGFQGQDPSTDFRGSGTFGLDCFHRFCISQPELAHAIVQQSGSYNGDPFQPWYSAALVSIHLTVFIMGLMTKHSTLIRGITRLLDLDVFLERCSSLISLAQPTTALFVSSASQTEASIIQTMSVQVREAIFRLHTAMLAKFHEQWLEAVENGVVKSVMDTESFLAQFERSIQTYIWKGDWADWSPSSASFL